MNVNHFLSSKHLAPTCSVGSVGLHSLQPSVLIHFIVIVMKYRMKAFEPATFMVWGDLLLSSVLISDW